LLISVADALADLGHWAEAARLYCKSLAVRPRDSIGHHNLAVVLLQLGQFKQAIEHCQAAIDVRPDYALALNTLGVALARTGRHAEASQVLKRALAIKPDFAKAAYNLGQSLDELGKRSEAMTAYRTALALDPQLAAAVFDLAALGGCPAPLQMPREYVLTLFDHYASSFDEHLTELGYAVPQSLFAAVSSVHPGPFARAVDLGCGTGLVGATFRPVVERLIGVDLSAVMIEASRARGVYDELVQAEVVEWLASPVGAIELVLAADVLIYLGELEPLFAGVAERLGSEGLFAFSIELTAKDRYVLRETRRYAHSVDYIRRLAAALGWSELTSSEQCLRSQGSQAVDGQLFVFRNGSSSGDEVTAAQRQA
jgi:predicted TPR repeat methyltransferase